MRLSLLYATKDASLGFLFLLGQAKRKSPGGGEPRKACEAGKIYP